VSGPQERGGRDVLLIENNPGDVRLIAEGFARGGVSHCLRVAEDGEEALAMLRREGEHAGRRLPELVLLDLNLPRLSGLDVLTALKSDPELRRIPVVVLTGSAAEPDVLAAYDRHANCYVTKPMDLHRLMDALEAIERFWLGHVRPAPR
jgi:two-component system, chemotaxis family, response regulator Rcp1